MEVEGGSWKSRGGSRSRWRSRWSEVEVGGLRGMLVEDGGSSWRLEVEKWFELEVGDRGGIKWRLEE